MAASEFTLEHGVLDDIAQIAPGSEYEPFESLTTDMLTKGDIDAMKRASAMLARMTTAELKRLGNYELWFRLARLMAKIGSYHDAIPFYRASVAIKPDEAATWYNLGIALKATGDVKGAIEGYRKAIAITPDDADAWCNLGVALKATGDVKGAIEALYVAIEALYNRVRCQYSP